MPPLGNVKSLHRVTMPPDAMDAEMAKQAALLHKFCVICGTRLQREVYDIKYDGQNGSENIVFESKCPLYDSEATGPGDRKTRGYGHDVVRV